MVDDSGAKSRAERLKRMLREQALIAAEAGARAVLENAKLRTPTVQEEYDILMQGEGEHSAVPQIDGSSADTDGRRRIIKELPSYLEHIVPSPENQEISTVNGIVVFKFGNRILLEQATKFQYTNKTSQGPMTYEKGPYFDNFEHGSVQLIVPVAVRKDGRFYPLRPDEHTKKKSMVKGVSPKMIFYAMTLYPVFQETVRAYLAEVGPGHT